MAAPTLAPHNPPRVLITGSGGFIGRALVARLANSRDYACIAAPREAASGQPHSVETRPTGDLAQQPPLENALRGVDIVVHAAARAHIIGASGAQALAAFRRVNVDATAHLARKACAAGVRRLVLLSSIGVHGTFTEGRPFTVDEPLSPREPYAVSKMEAEQAVAAELAGSNTDYVIVRPPLVYGADAPGNFRRLLQAVYRGIPLPFGNVHNARSMIARENLVDLIIRCLEHPGAAAAPVLAADGQDLSTPELIRRLAEGMQRPARVFPLPSGWLRLVGTLGGRRESVERLLGSLQIDITGTRERLDWSPPLDPHTALRTAAEAFARRQRAAPDIPADTD